MKVYLNEITGLDDALVSMYMSKRTWTPELDERIRKDWWRCYYGGEPDNEEEWQKSRKETANRIKAFLKYAWMHTTMLDFITVSATVQGIHRAGQDDWDAHACRFNNRIIRASTRLADFSEGEMSDFYKGKIMPTDIALKEVFNTVLPENFEKDGQEYVKVPNGYVVKGMEYNRDIKRGLYMESIPSNFIFKVNMAQWAHVYRLRKKGGTTNPEVQQLAEMLQDEIEKDMPWFNREFLAKVQI